MTVQVRDSNVSLNKSYLRIQLKKIINKHRDGLLLQTNSFQVGEHLALKRLVTKVTEQV